MDRVQTTQRCGGEIDARIGAKIRAMRVMRGLTQGSLAEAIGVTYQQMHKYERGANRVAVARLLEIARALAVPARVFIEGIEKPVREPRHSRAIAAFAEVLQEIDDPDDVSLLITAARALGRRQTSK